MKDNNDVKLNELIILSTKKFHQKYKSQMIYSNTAINYANKEKGRSNQRYLEGNM